MLPPAFVEVRSTRAIVMQVRWDGKGDISLQAVGTVRVTVQFLFKAGLFIATRLTDLVLFSDTTSVTVQSNIYRPVLQFSSVGWVFTIRLNDALKIKNIKGMNNLKITPFRYQ